MLFLLYPVAVSGLFCLAMLSGTASANLKDPLQGCSATLDCGDRTMRAATTTDAPKNAETGSTADFIARERPEYEELPLALAHPEFFGYISQNAEPPPSLAGAVVAANSDPVPEPASVAILGAALLWFRLARGRRAKQ